MPLTPSLKDSQFTSSDRYKKLKRLNQIRSWGSEIDEHNFTVAAFFRQPEERIISAYYDGRHANGFTPEIWQAAIKASRGGPCKIGNVTYNNALECFARFPGIAGCMARMLTGEKCADGLFQQSGFENVAEAVDIILNKLEFIGLTEDWNESLCQFHRLFGGKVDERTGKRTWNPPSQGEFQNVHSSGEKKNYGIKDLNGFKDAADSVVYEAAKLKFERMVGDQRCYKYMTMEELEAEAIGNTIDTSFLRTDAGGKVCKPQTCTQLGKQCGEWDDGCGATVVCGMCNAGRTGLPSTWRVQCVEGKCIDYCPPWRQHGLWFKTDIDVMANADTSTGIADLAKYVASHFPEGQAHLTPTDAVNLCHAACTLKNENTNELLKSGMCKCGTAPTIFINSNISIEDYSLAHDLKTNCLTSRARKLAVLKEEETQPICCPYYNQTSARPPQWKRLSFMSLLATRADNLEGEYFSHIRVDCGGYEACESHARESRAELAVLDIFNNMCYLARNVFELKDSYSVAKDNLYRYYLDLR